MLLKTGQLKSSHAQNIEIDYDNYYEITDKLLCYLIGRLFTRQSDNCMYLNVDVMKYIIDHYTEQYQEQLILLLVQGLRQLHSVQEYHTNGC